LAADTTITANQADLDSDDEPTIEVLADSAYGSGDMLAAVDAAGHVPVIKPWSIKPAVVGGFSIDDFAYDPDAGTLTCPNGITRPLSPKRTVTFGAACRTVRCATGAPPEPTDAPSRFTNTRRCYEPTGPEPPMKRCKPPTGLTGQWSNAPSPG
jgi:hypothetical protein